MNKNLIILLTMIVFLFNLFSAVSLGKLKSEKTDSKLLTCSSVGNLQCPKGFKPFCPNSAKPTCIFLGAKQQPACMENSKDKITYNYNLNSITCVKDK